MSLGKVRQERVRAAGISLFLILFVAGGVYFWNTVVSAGILLGGLAGLAGLWLLASRLEKLTQGEAQALQAFSFKWTAVRLVIYGVGLGLAYLLDPVAYSALLGAVVALLATRMVMIFLAFSGTGPRKG